MNKIYFGLIIYAFFKTLAPNFCKGPGFGGKIAKMRMCVCLLLDFI